MVAKPRKPRIIRETVKDLHTSHWDLDMLSLSDLEILMGASRENPVATAVTTCLSASLEQFSSASTAPNSGKPDQT